MNDFFEYKNYFGSICYSDPDSVLYGKVLGIRSLISYEGDTIKSLKNDFQEAVEDYLELCEEQGKAPEISCFSPKHLQLSPDLQQEVEVYSQTKGTPFQEVVEQAVVSYLEMWRKSPETTG